MLTVCASLLFLSLIAFPVSFVFVVVGIPVGLLDAGISVNELAGGKFLSWFSLPLFLVGQFVAAYLAAAPANSFGFTTQYLLVIVCIDMIIVILFRARIERFVTTRQRPIS